MSETNMPAAEVGSSDEKNIVSYELAFHLLPTVAEGEVPAVFAKIKDQIASHQGEIFGEEIPQRFDLAFPIVKYLEGKNRKFSSAYFGWVRFRMTGEALVTLTEEIDGSKDILRYLLVKLTKVEEANPFAFHESIADRKVINIGTDDLLEVAEVAEVAEVIEGEEAVVVALAEEEIVASAEKIDGQEEKETV